MKKLFFLILLPVALHVDAQTTLRKLFGAHWNGTTDVFTSVHVDALQYTLVATMPGTFSVAQGNTTFDDANFRYFTHTSAGILVINSLTGQVVDTITNVGNIGNIEYDAGGNRLLGVQFNLAGNQFIGINLATGTPYTISMLPPCNGVFSGESTFDPANRRYFVATGAGVFAIDSMGAVTNTYNPVANICGIEFNPLDGKLYGIVSVSGGFNFLSVNLATGDLDQYNPIDGASSYAQGETTFDKTLGHYYIRFSNNIFVINANTGLTMLTIPLAYFFGGMEYRSVTYYPTTGIPRQRQLSFNVGPNPTAGELEFHNLPENSSISIYDGAGRLLRQESAESDAHTIDIRDFPAGVYSYLVLSANEVKRGKVILHP